MTIHVSIRIDGKAVLRAAAMVGTLAIMSAVGVAYAIPKPFTPGQTLKAADLTEAFGYIEDRLAVVEGALAAKSRVSVRDVVPFTLNSGPFTKITFASELYDDKSEYDLASHTFSPQEDGDYEICARSRLNNSNVDSAELVLFRNGGVEASLFGPDSDGGAGCRTVRLSSGDEVDVRIGQGSGSTLLVPASPQHNWLTINQLD